MTDSFLEKYLIPSHLPGKISKLNLIHWNVAAVICKEELLILNSKKATTTRSNENALHLYFDRANYPCRQ